MSQLNLRTILSGDNISSVVEKINYNFQQLVLNGGGPQGDRGFIGPPGLPGPEGPTGPYGPTGPTGTHTYVGLTAPNSVSNLQPPPRIGDIYIQSDTLDNEIVFWEFDGSTWHIVAVLNAADGLFTTAEQYAGGDQRVTAVYPRLNKASKLIIVDNDAGLLEDQVFVTDGSVKKTSPWLDQSFVRWGAMFADVQNQIRLLNTDPAITGPSATDRLTDGGGVLISYEAVAGGSGKQILRITNGDIAPSANNKFFALGISDLGGTVSIFTDEQNRVAIYGSGDPNQPLNTMLVDPLTVFGSALVYSPEIAKFRVDTDAGFPDVSSMFLSRGSFNGSTEAEYEFRLGNGANFADHALRLLATDGANSGPVFTIDIASVDDRGGFAPRVAIGGSTKAIAEVEIGVHNSGKLGLGQISPTASNSYAASYVSANAFREKGGATAATWTLRGDGFRNGGAIQWMSSNGTTLSFVLVPSTGGGNRTITGDAFLSTESSVTMKKPSGSVAHMFIDNFAYTQLSDSVVANAPHLVLGQHSSNPLPFNFGNVSQGLGLHGPTNSIEWVTGQDGSNATGFRTIPILTTIGGTSATILTTQYRSYADSAWKTVMSVISTDYSGGGTYSGNVVIGPTVPSTAVGKAKFTVIGSTGPTSGGLSGPSLGSPEIVDFKTAGGTSMFTLDRDGNVVAGVRFGNLLYDSDDRFTLDHYEEGVWTPVLLPHGYENIAGWTNNAYKVYKANYVRVGKKVRVDYTIKVDNFTTSPGSFPGLTGSMFIAGFPYKPDFENVSGVGASVGDPLNPQYPVIALKSSGFEKGVASDAPAGTIIAWPGSTSTIPAGWASCNGAAYVTTDYPDLNNVLSTAGFNGVLPDLRGYFIRGVDNGAGIDIGRVLGSIQQDEFESHLHGLYYRIGRSDDTESGVDSGYLRDKNASGGGNYGFATTQTEVAGGASETRPKNMALNYIIALGRSSSTVGMDSGEMSGGFVLYDGAKTRLYLYSYPPGKSQRLSNLNIGDIPMGSTAVSYLFGSHEYFISDIAASPVIGGGPFSYIIGSSTFGFSLNNLIATDYPLMSVNVTGMPSWMTYNTGSGNIEFAVGVTQVPGPATSYSLTISAVNSGTPVPGTGSISVSTTTQTVPVVTGVGSTSQMLTTAFSLGYTASQGPITSWELFWYTGGVTSSMGDSAVTLSSTGSTASVSFSSSYPQGSNPAFQDFWIQAFNGTGVGGTAFQVVMTTPPGSPVYWESTSNVNVSGGSWTMDIYDSAVGGNLMSSASYFVGNYSSVTGLFTNFITLTPGSTYYVEGFVYPNDVLDSGQTFMQESASQQFFTNFSPSPPTYTTPARLAFVYNGATAANSIFLNILHS
jgi:hypothetical protein